jgi:hypothetical protein
MARLLYALLPTPDSFVRQLIAWWIDSDTGIAIRERSAC